MGIKITPLQNRCLSDIISLLVYYIRASALYGTLTILCW
nr:MAG TPA: hypothetical protein [Caudoviricetes sp.]